MGLSQGSVQASQDCPHWTGKTISLWNLFSAQGHCHMETGKGITQTVGTKLEEHCWLKYEKRGFSQTRKNRSRPKVHNRPFPDTLDIWCIQNKQNQSTYTDKPQTLKPVTGFNVLADRCILYINMEILSYTHRNRMPSLAATSAIHFTSSDKSCNGMLPGPRLFTVITAHCTPLTVHINQQRGESEHTGLR